MPEGHSVHRLARQFQDVFAGRRLQATSPQGRFADGAALLTGHFLEEATAQGKQMFLRFEHGRILHVHLGLYGAWSFGGDRTFIGASSIGAPRRIGEQEAAAGLQEADYAGPPEPVGAVRVRLVSDHGWADLRGATTCAVISEAEVAAVRQRLGPDPLRNGPGDREEFLRRITRRRTAVGLLLMEQSVVAGLGNIYRAEVLFRQGIDPWLPGSSLDPAAALGLWDDAVAAMSDGVRDGRIVTTPPAYWTGSPDPKGLQLGSLPEDAHFVYKRAGLPCRRCGTPVGIAEIGARKLYWCPRCQN